MAWKVRAGNAYIEIEVNNTRVASVQAFFEKGEAIVYDESAEHKTLIKKVVGEYFPTLKITNAG